jgi:branched-chain amino acid aminotransferase
MKVWLNGRILEHTEARISVVDHGLLYGDGVFEGMRAYGGRMFRLDDHLRRFEVSARAIGLELPARDRLREIVLATVAATGAPEAYVRLVVTRGEGPLGLDPTTCPLPTVFCIADSVEIFSKDKTAAGVALVVSSLRRPGPDVLDPRIKSLNYLNNVLAKLEARRQGADDALLLNARGEIAEATAANVFVARNDRLMTPPATDGALEGITRATVLELAPDLGLVAEERTLTRIDVLGADEAFLSGTGARIVPIRSLDGQPIGTSAPGPITAKIRDRYLALARSSGTPVPYASGIRV